jgi:integrating conjugative element protein (TIGR03746 family)
MVNSEKIMSNPFFTLFTAWKREDRDSQLISLQMKFIYVMAALCLLLGLGWMSAPSRMTVYIPPDISNGATLKAGEIPAPLVYSFAYEVWQEINYWPTEGSTDYDKNVKAYWSYLTPGFKSDLLREADELKTAGQSQRQRFMQGTAGSAYTSTSVKKLSDSTWEVDLTMRLTEYKNNQPVKDVEITYPLKVTRMDVSQRNNPYGLALAGFASEPVRVKTYT